MTLTQRILKNFEGTRVEPLLQGARRTTWSHVRLVGERDHVAIAHAFDLLLRKNSNCLDVGANKGDTIEQIVRLAPLGTHVAFEPIPRHAQELRRRFPGVDVRQNAVADKAGRVTFNIDLKDDALSGLKQTGSDLAGENGKPRSTQAIEVDVVKIDEVVDPDRPIHLIKIDVEGAELLALRGAFNLLRRHKPAVIFEFQKERAPAFGMTPHDTHDLLVTQLGYSMFCIDGRGPLSRDDLRRVYDEGSSFNFLARDY